MWMGVSMMLEMILVAVAAVVVVGCCGWLGRHRKVILH